MFDSPSLLRSGIAARALPAQAGVGLRPLHHELVRTERPAAAWFEAHAENFMSGGLLAEDLDEIARNYAVSLHAVGLSLGSADGLDAQHLARFKTLIERYRPALVSDHLSWSSIGGAHAPDLLPLPYTRECLDIVADNIARAQDAIGRALLLENPSVYLRFADSPIPEAAFLGALADRTGCGVLLDVNNVYVSARNLGDDPLIQLDSYLREITPDAIGEVHLAGHEQRDTPSGHALLVDTHGAAICDAVWGLYELAIAVLGPRPTLIEWDTDIPAFDVLTGEAERAQALLDVTTNEGADHVLA